MNNILKKVALFGVGIYEVSREKLGRTVSQLKKEGVTPEEGKKFIKDVVDDLEKDAKGFEKKVKNTVEDTKSEIADDLGFATKKDIQKLRKEIKEQDK